MAPTGSNDWIPLTGNVSIQAASDQTQKALIVDGVTTLHPAALIVAISAAGAGVAQVSELCKVLLYLSLLKLVSGAGYGPTGTEVVAGVASLNLA